MSSHPPWRVPDHIAALVASELTTARASDDPWPSLERAHVVSQPWAWPHTRVHFVMLRLALTQRDRRELVGQILRLAVAGPGSLTGKYPPGNTGRVTMRLTETAPLPADLAQALVPYTSPVRRTPR